MVADPLTGPPGPRAAAGPPRGMTSFWARVRADTPGALDAALSHLAPAAAQPTLRRGLVQVDWTALLGFPEAAERVRAFAARRPGVLSTWVPQCHPGAPQFDTLGRFATPPDCAACVFYRGRACQGLGAERVPFGALEGNRAPPALQALPPERDLRALTSADFNGTRPVCYWRPERAHVAAIGAAVRAAGGTLWDLGAGNGFLAALLARDEGLSVTTVDQLDTYPCPAGVTRRVGDVRAVALDPGGPPPAAVLISWPPGGDGFRDVVSRLRPAVLVLAYDAEGFCGRRRGHAQAEVDADGARWFTQPLDDFAAMRGLPRRARWSVTTHQDVVRERRGGSGVLEIRARDPRPVVSDHPHDPYPWEGSESSH